MARGDAARIRRLHKAVDFWASFLGLSQQWNIHITIGRLEQSSEDHIATSEVTYAYPYRKIDICFDRRQFDEARDDEVEATVVHELIHVLLEPSIGPLRRLMGPDLLDIQFTPRIEATVDILTRILVRLHSPKREGPRYD